jgi:hypothetical protein
MVDRFVSSSTMKRVLDVPYHRIPVLLVRDLPFVTANHTDNSAIDSYSERVQMFLAGRRCFLDPFIKLVGMSFVLVNVWELSRPPVSPKVAAAKGSRLEA